MSEHQPGRRSARRRTRRLDVTALLAVVLPVLCALALWAVRPGGSDEVAHPPTRTTLTRATVVCPTAMPDGDPVSLTSAGDSVSGQVNVGLGKDTTSAKIESGRVSTADPGRRAVAVTGEGETAPGLVASRFGGKQLAAVGCPAPSPEAWFTGVGAGAGHTSVLELINPDAGAAIADITVYGNSGVVDASRLRGVSVPGGSSVELDLASIVPRRDELTLQVVTSRGRLGSAVLDSRDEIGSRSGTRDWLPAQTSPSESNYLMGLAPGRGGRTLVLANGGADEVRAEVKVVTKDSVFAPQGMPEIRVPPQSVKRITVSGELAKAIVDGANGLLVTSSGPITASLRSLIDGDLSHAVPSDPVSGSTAVLVPKGKKTLSLAGADRSGTVTVVSRTAAGKQLASKKVEMEKGRGSTLALPADAALISVVPARTSVVGAVLVTDSGAAVVPLIEPAKSGLVPDVRPGLP